MKLKNKLAKPSISMPKVMFSHLFVAMWALLASNSLQADVDVKNIGDLEIYQQAQGGETSLMMMIDTSGSMGISSLVLPKDNKYGSPGDVDKPLCTHEAVAQRGIDSNHDGKKVLQWKYDAPPTKKQVTVINGKTHTYYLRGCYDKSNGNKIVYDRLSRMKEALIQLLSSKSVSDSIIMGLGHYSSYTPFKVTDTQNRLVDSHSGTILVEAKPLTPEHRNKLIEALIQFKSVDGFTNEDGTANPDRKASSKNQPEEYKAAGGTPTAQAYAEAGAAMLGTNTGHVYNYLPKGEKVKLIYDGSSTHYNHNINKQIYFTCNKSVGYVEHPRPGEDIIACINKWDGQNVSSLLNMKFSDLIGGWSKVPYEPLDLETVTGLVWLNQFNHAGNVNGQFYGQDNVGGQLVLYRTSPFALKTKDILGNYGCPSGEDFNPKNNTCSRYYKQQASRRWWSNNSCHVGVRVDGKDYNFLHQENYTRGTVICHYMNTYPAPRQATKVADEDGYNMGGFDYSTNAAKTGSNYTKIAKKGECSANGIYFLTDGVPNSSRKSIAANVMNLSLGDKGNFSSTIAPTGLTSPPITQSLFGEETGAWEYIGEYAKRLNDPTKNPAGVSIKTAVAGFGTSFAGLDYDAATKKYDCNTQGASQDAKNACKWGQRGEGYGEGGFFYTQSSQDIADSIVNFISSLDNTLPSSPSGVITVPKDPFKAIGEMPYAFMPTVEPRVGGGSNSNIWPGNVKKYNLHNGTLQGKNNTNISTNVFTDVAGNLNGGTADLWANTSSAKPGEKHDSVTVGGLYSNLKAPNHPNPTDNIRTLYVEDLTAKGQTTTTFKKITVDGFWGTVTGLDDLVDTNTYTQKNKLMLLQFLGFERAAYKENGKEKYTKNLSEMYDMPDIKMKNLVLKKTSNANKVLGASIHSKPVAVSYGASLDDKGRVLDTDRQDYVFFGSMDGALHLVNAKDQANGGGTEDVVIIPRIMMQTQPEALVPNSTYSNGRAPGVPKFGIDGHWVLKNSYDYDYTTKKAKPADKVLAYGGMRLGGEGLLALDITDKTKPNKAFTSQSSALIDSKTLGFERIGHIWNQPTLARIKKSESDTNGTDVIIFGGGYDMCYEYEGFQHGITDSNLKNCSKKTDIKGNAVYIVDAKSGQLLWRASNTNGNGNGTKITNSDLKHSIVAGISAIDRNADGITDHLYFGDLGGQLFRVDFKDGNITSSSITKLLKNEYENTANAKYTHRFYEMPVVSIHRNPTSNQLFALINIVSGDRSSPLSKMRDNNQYADRVYGIIDTDVTKINLFDTNFTKTVKDLTNDKLVDLSTAMGTVPSTGYTDTQRINAMQPMIKGIKQGWYYPLTRFDGWSNVRYGKGVGKSDIFANHLYISVFNPDMSYSNANACTAKIAGGTERQMYCLPYGICMDPAGTPAQQKRYTQSKNGTAGFIRAGQGLQELNFGPISSDRTDARVLINTTSITEQIKKQNRVNFGTDNDKKLRPPSVGLGNQSGSSSPNDPPIIGLDQTNIAASGSSSASSVAGDGTGELSIESQRYMLQPRQWYEKP